MGTITGFTAAKVTELTNALSDRVTTLENAPPPAARTDVTPPSLVGVVHPLLVLAGEKIVPTLTPVGVRMRMPISGTINNVFIRSDTSVAWRCGIYSTAATRALLANPAAVTGTAGGRKWFSVGSPNLAVNQDDELDVVVMPITGQNAASIPGGYAGTTAAAVLPAEMWPLPSGGALSKLSFSYPAQATHVLPATVPEASVLNYQDPPAIFLTIT